MELTLTRQSGTQILVTCDSHPSHTFDLLTLLPHEKGLPQALDETVSYGQAIYAALFPPETAAHRTLADAPKRILLVTTDNDVDAVPWEYVYGSYGSEDSESFLVQECHFVRGVPADQRIAPPTLDTSLHIVAVPSNPLSHELDPLNIDGEWLRLKEIIQHVPYVITIERTRPPSIEQVRTLVANQRQRVLHFMGHGGKQEAGAVLCFEKDNGELDLVTAKQFVQRVRGTVFLVTLNACVSATPGAAGFSNLARALVRERTPYALGMRFSIPDEDARALSRAFYNDLARGSSVEEAMRQARLTLPNSPHCWVIGVPVLYTSLTQPATGFASLAGSPLIKDHQPYMEVSVLPRAEGAFQGRIDELKALGTELTSVSRPPLVTIHGAGGQGKTALAREAVERFAYAWSGGAWATSLENLPSRELFVSDLARFLGIETQQVADSNEVERLVIDQLVHCRILIVLDNVETLVKAVEMNSGEAIRLAQFLGEQVPRPPVTLLATSRSFLGWTDEIGFELGGLTSIEGVKLFQQHAPQRENEINPLVAWQLSEKVEGHPLSLQLLGRAFNASTLPLATFIEEYVQELLRAENKYKDLEHRQRTLYTSIETSVCYLDGELRNLLSGLWVFHAPFLPQAAEAIFGPGTDDPGRGHSLIYDQLNELWQRSLLTRELVPVSGVRVLLYHLLPVVRVYVEKYLQQAYEREELLKRFGHTCDSQVGQIFSELNRSAVWVYIARRARSDFEWGIAHVGDSERIYYLLRFGSILHRLGDNRKVLELDEEALEIAQSRLDRQMEGQALANIGAVYNALGQPQLALECLEQALQSIREIGDQASEAAVLNSMAHVYQEIGQPQRALGLYGQVLSMRREIGDRQGDAVTLNNMAVVYQSIGQSQKALESYEQALPVRREVGDRVGEASTLTNMGWMYHRIGQIEAALKLYQQALPIWREMGDRTGEASALNNMALLYQETGRPQRAQELYEQVLPINRELGDRRGEATTLNNIALVYWIGGQFRQALELFEQALSMRQEVGDRQGEAETLNNIATIYQETGQFQQALEFLERALPIVREINHRADEGSILTNMAEIYLDTDHPQRALELSEQALSIRREVGDKGGEAATLNKMATAYQDMGQLPLALKLYEQALPIAREVGDRQSEAETLGDIAIIYSKTGQNQQALELLKRVLALRRELGDRSREAITLFAMAGTHRETGQLEQALELYGQALLTLREAGDRTTEALVLDKMAEVYQEIGQFQWALELYEQSLLIDREVGDRRGEAETLKNIATIYQETMQPKRALELHAQALSILHELGDRPGEGRMLVNMAEAYQKAGQIQQALELHEQVLKIEREIGERASEAATLNNMAVLHRVLDQPQQALELYEQSLPISREIGNPRAEALLLTSMARLYQDMRQPQQAFKLYEQALPILREVGDRRGEATTLNNMAVLYRAISQPQQTLELYGQVLSVVREVGDRQGEAAILNEMAVIYHDMKQMQHALDLYGRALPIHREVGNREGEAVTLNNIALVYLDTGQFLRALEFLEQALELDRQDDARTREAGTLANIAGVYFRMMQPERAVELYEQTLEIEREVGEQASEAATLADLAVVLYRSLNRTQEAIKYVEQAINLLMKLGLLQDKEGRSTHSLQHILQTMRIGAPLEVARNNDMFIADRIHTVIVNTIAAMTAAQDHRAKWRESMVNALQQAQQKGIDWQSEVDLFTAILALLDGQIPTLPDDHPYASALAQIQESIATYKEEDEEGAGEDDTPIDAELISRSIVALLDGPQEKMLFAQYVAELNARTTDEGLQALLQYIQLALFGGDLFQLGQNLSGVYKEAWETIVIGVESEGIDPRLFSRIAQNTLTVLGPAAEKQGKWRNTLVQLKSQVLDNGRDRLIALLDAVIGLLDADGNPAGLGTNLTGIYKQTWQAIIEHLPS